MAVLIVFSGFFDEKKEERTVFVWHRNIFDPFNAFMCYLVFIRISIKKWNGSLTPKVYNFEYLKKKRKGIIKSNLFVCVCVFGV